MFERPDLPRETYRRLYSGLRTLRPSTFVARTALVDRAYLSQGITFDHGGREQPWIEPRCRGWGGVELDPTHPDPSHEDYVRLAVGRDYADVPPLRGSYLGPPTEAMTVVVRAKELPC